MAALDPLALFVCIAAAAVVGVAKGGFGGVGTLMGAPLLSVGLPPAQAVGVMLPVLLVIDVIAVTSYRNNFDRMLFWRALPGAAVGVAAGALLLAHVDDNAVRGLIGVVALAFAWNALAKPAVPRAAGPPSRALASGFGAACGFTSAVAHAGGPPIHIYLLRQGLDPATFVGTASIFMAVVNVMKIAPYALIGQLNVQNLSVALIMAPVAGLAALAGVWMARRISRRLFSRIVNVLMVVVGLKLLWDGALGLYGA